MKRKWLIRVYVCMYVCKYACKYVYTPHTGMYTYVCICMYVCITYVCITYVCMYIHHIYVSIYIHVHGRAVSLNMERHKRVVEELVVLWRHTKVCYGGI